ncbi:MAG: glycosyltransferase [Erysipelotrichaceae bacterium]|nr:glycosyltransferase [Erysipelotrichaceae bacterium]
MALKKILIFSQTMELGGAETALLGLLEGINTDEYDIDLFLMHHEGELYRFIPKKINILPESPQYSSLAVPLKTVLKKGQLGIAYGRYKGKKAARARVQDLGLPEDNDVSLQFSHLYTLPYMPQINHKEYDLAVSFLTPHYFVAEKVSAKKKVAWIHTDYSKVSVDKETQLKMWDRYNYIVSISEQVTNSFLRVFPELKSKIIEIHNMIPMNYLNQKKDMFTAEREMPQDGSIRLLSIGRFCTAKNFDNVPDICSRIRAKGLNVKWYLIGYGADEELIKERIEEAGMQEYVIILGKKENPYPYIKACDLYVQPSRYEGKCVSVIEAQILNKPVVITDYVTSSSQLNNGVDGVIVPLDNQKCAVGICNLLNDSKKMAELVINCKKTNYSNSEEIMKIYSLL